MEKVDRNFERQNDPVDPLCLLVGWLVE